jgi:hypothetical protein
MDIRNKRATNATLNLEEFDFNCDGNLRAGKKFQSDRRYCDSLVERTIKDSTILRYAWIADDSQMRRKKIWKKTTIFSIHFNGLGKERPLHIVVCRYFPKKQKVIVTVAHGFQVAKLTKESQHLHAEVQLSKAILAHVQRLFSVWDSAKVHMEKENHSMSCELSDITRSTAALGIAR